MKHVVAHSLKRLVRTVIAGSVILASVLPTTTVSAATNVLYVAPSTSQMNIGTTFCVDVASYAGADAATGTATGTLSYTSTKLQLVQVKTNGKKCPDTQGNEVAPSFYSNRTVTTGIGTVDFDASQDGADSGVRYVFAVTFKTKAAGTATISFSGDSRVNGAQPTMKSGTFTITAPQSTSTPKPTSKPSSSPTPSPTVTPSTPPKTTTPTNIDIIPETKTDPTGLIDSVIATPLYTTGAVSWKVNAANPTSSISYGTTYDELDKQGEVKKNSDGTYSATLSGLLPGTYYYFSITAKGKNVDTGNYSSSFVTNGYPVTLTITENNIPVQNAQVKIGEQSLTANNGTLTIGLAAGNYSGTITTDTATLNINLTVKEVAIPTDGSAPEAQAFGPFKLSSSPLDGGPGSSFSIFAFIGVLAGGTILLVFGFVVFMNYRRHKFESGTYSTTPTSTVVIEDGYDWQRDSDAHAPDTHSTPNDQYPYETPQNPNLPRSTRP